MDSTISKSIKLLRPKSKKARQRQRKREAEMAAAPEGITIGEMEMQFASMSVEQPWVTEPDPTQTEEYKERERINKVLENWPWEGAPAQLVSLSVFAINRYHANDPFRMPQVSQTSPLFTKLFRNELMLTKIMNCLFQNHDPASKFAATSQQSWDCITRFLDFWDIRRGYFHNCQNPRYGPNAPQDVARHGSVASVVVVSPVRGPEVEPDYVTQLRHLRTMCVAMSNFADYFRNIQFHRIPFLTAEILALIIPKMRNLKVLGVYKCPLINIGHAMKLLKIIKTDKPLERENQVSLDFFPQFHVGPVDEPGRDNKTGSYGITWDNFGGDSRLAVWKLVKDILAQARSQNVDFESTHTMFRKWLDMGPCWKVEDTLLAIMDPDIPNDEFVVWVNYPHLKGDVLKLRRKPANSPQGWDWTLKHYPCKCCKQQVLGVFFDYWQINNSIINRSIVNRSTTQLTCLGCKLRGYLTHEEDHYKVDKRQLIRRWLWDKKEGWNSTDLQKALADFQRHDLRWGVNSLVRKRLEDLNRGVDREKDEVQRQPPRDWCCRCGEKDKAPTIQEKDKEPSMWNWFREDRLHAHGY